MDLKTLYAEGPNSTLFYYVSSKIGYSSNYYSVHRTFPGTTKGSNTAYDPANRPWFRNAPGLLIVTCFGGLFTCAWGDVSIEDAVYADGPYLETYSQKLVINLSSRKSSSALANTPLTLVAAGDILLSELQTIVNDVAYENNGFGAILKFGTYEVLIWKNGTDIYDDDSASFKTLEDVDPLLYASNGDNLETQSTFEYADAEGVTWIVACVPFFDSTSYLTGQTKSAFIMLVFQQRVMRCINI
jgi:hypothetical protein